jgi:hypothetical protein
MNGDEEPLRSPSSNLHCRQGIGPTPVPALKIARDQPRRTSRSSHGLQHNVLFGCGLTDRTQLRRLARLDIIERSLDMKRRPAC